MIQLPLQSPAVANSRSVSWASRACNTPFLASLAFSAIAIATALAQTAATTPRQAPLSPADLTPPQVRTGSATAGVFAPVLDAERRPITAGGFVKDGPVIFKDIAHQAGLDT